MKNVLLAFLTLTLTACGNYKMPGVAQAPAEMSADTLCFGYYSSQNPALEREIAARGLDCMSLLEDDPLYNGQAREDLDAAHRMSR